MPIISKQKIRLLLMGTPDFSLAGFQSLIDNSHFEIVGVFTQLDKKIGRQQILTPPPVKKWALQNNLTVFQPQKLKLKINTIQNLQVDLIVVIAYGKIIPQEILDIPRWGCLNVHASLLPKYRGAACLNAPILNGDSETGITIMKIDAGLDTGPILRQAKIQLTGQETLKDVHDKLSELGAKLLVPAIQDFISGKIKAHKQNENQATYVKMINKEDGRINWHQSALEIERMIRAYYPWPGTYSENSSKILKIIEVQNKILKINNYQIGEIFQDDQKLAIQTGQDALIILKLQESGKKAMSAQDFLSGHQNIIGTILK